MENKASQGTFLLGKSRWSLFIPIIFLWVLVFGTTGCRNEVASANDLKEKIYFADSTCASSQVHNRIASFIVKNGYEHPVEHVSGETLVLFEGLIKGDLDVSMEFLRKDIEEMYAEGIESGNIKDLGSNLKDSFEEKLITVSVKSNEKDDSCYEPENVVKIINSGIENRAPDIVSFFDKYEVTLKQINKALLYMQENEGDPEVAAIWFLKEYPEQWKEWVSEDAALKIEKALSEIKL